MTQQWQEEKATTIKKIIANGIPVEEIAEETKALLDGYKVDNVTKCPLYKADEKDYHYYQVLDRLVPGSFGHCPFCDYQVVFY